MLDELVNYVVNLIKTCYILIVNAKEMKFRISN